MNDTHSITFIGGPLDLTRQVFVGNVPPYWRVAKMPKIGALYSKPELPGVLPAAVSFDYQIMPLTTPDGSRIYVGLPMTIPEVNW